MSRPVGRHRARRTTGIHALRRPAVAATAAISTVSVASAAYAGAASASASVAGSAQAKIAFGAPAQTSTALRAANAAVSADGRAQLAAANEAVSARSAAEAKTRSAVATNATTAKKLQHKAAASAKAAVRAEAAKKAAAKKAAAKEAAKKEAAKKAAATKAQETQRSAAPGTSRSDTRPTPSYSGSPQAIASSMLGSYGWGQDQMGCLVSLWNRESGWNVYAANPSSGAYGIPQSLPGSKMASAGADWRTNPATQIRWGLGYIKSTYGSPCGAWGHSQATGWY